MADGRLAVLLAHLAPNPSPSSLQPGSRGAAPWAVAPNGPLIIIGGVCLDIQAQPSTVDVQRGTSVPGQVRQVPGGVGRNMAEALSQLVPPDRPAPVFVSLVGDDTAGSFLAASLRRIRLDLTLLMTCPGAATPCVSAVLDRGGEVAAAVADVAAVEQLLTPERLAECRARVHQASMLLAEANLSAESLEYVARTAAAARVPVFLEPVSVPKAARLLRALPFATFVSPNASELIALADEIRRAAGLPLLPRPVLPGAAPAAAEPQDGAAPAGTAAADGGGASSGDGQEVEPAALVLELLRQLAAFAEVVLMQGTGYVVLTLGSLGAALITLSDPDAAAAAASSTSRSTLEPLDASCRASNGGACGGGALCGADCGSGGAGGPVTRMNACGVGRHNTSAPPSCAVGAGERPGAACGGGAGVGRPGLAALSGPCGGGPLTCWMAASAAAAAAAAAPGSGAVWAGCAAPGALALQPTTQQYQQQQQQQYHQEQPQQQQLQAQPRAQTARRAVEVVHLRALPAEVVSVNGAGDTLVAGMVAALLQQHQPVQALAYGMAAAKRAVESHRNTPELDFASLRPDAERVLASLHRHVFPPSAAIAAAAVAAPAAAAAAAV